MGYCRRHIKQVFVPGFPAVCRRLWVFVVCLFFLTPMSALATGSDGTMVGAHGTEEWASVVTRDVFTREMTLEVPLLETDSPMQRLPSISQAERFDVCSAAEPDGGDSKDARRSTVLCIERSSHVNREARQVTDQSDLLYQLGCWAGDIAAGFSPTGKAIFYALCAA